MLKEMIEQGFGEKEDLNCAEKILQGANIAYKLGLNRESMKLAAGFGGGMGIGDKCGALTASVMVLGCLFVEDRAHESTKIRELTKELFEAYSKEMGAIDCIPLKEKHASGELKCRKVIAKAAEVLDNIVMREMEA
ncbi:MAG TPA: C-GCAxxG-C-C family (seleno)protein [Clostridia bacterium]|nr:C-GCAxxG-C-C family (seleno)protein [Clostridia bacterium]